MPLKTTVVGAWPKPEYLEIPDWFKSETGHAGFDPRFYEKARKENENAADNVVERALRETISAQESLGLDVITDGELGRENYIWHFCRNLNGMDFQNLETVTYRDGATTSPLPRVIGPLTHKGIIPKLHEPSLYKEWLKAQALTSVPVKYTLPGPLTISDTTYNATQSSRKEVMQQAVLCLRAEIQALIQAGCKYIQIDEPCLLRHPEIALTFGIEMASGCFNGLDTNSDIEKIVHLCCGYPNKLDQENYQKADKNLYKKLAPLLEGSTFTQVSIEDKEAQNDLQLLSEFKRLTVIFGSIAVARSRVESVEEIKDRLQKALEFIPHERLIVAPDCGLGFLDQQMAKEKISNMVKAAKLV